VKSGRNWFGRGYLLNMRWLKRLIIRWGIGLDVSKKSRVSYVQLLLFNLIVIETIDGIALLDEVLSTYICDGLIFCKFRVSCKGASCRGTWA